MSTEAMMNKPLDGAGLAIVNQIFNERLSELGGGSGGVDWETTPYLSMNYINNNDVFFSALMSTERRSSTIRYVRSTIIAYVKSDSYSGNAQILVTLPGDFPELTFPDNRDRNGRYGDDRHRKQGSISHQPGKERHRRRSLCRMCDRNCGRVKAKAS